MRRVYKYTIDGKNAGKLMMPFGAEILTVQMQDGNITLWALVDPDQYEQGRHFDIYGTGWDIDTSTPHEYIGTVQRSGMVWHVFEIIPKN